ncbi:MAG TPA: hypothetical protein IAC03_04010 [Candidatus Coprenecus pullistercoris]|nr:hypothetical protein [Candidatus Coprenecus pullistercoris]
MFNTMVSSLYSQTNMEGTLLTKEQVDEISTRISKKVSENVTKQLENAMSEMPPDKEQKGKQDDM